jgi:hypothetical protein
MQLVFLDGSEMPAIDFHAGRVWHFPAQDAIHQILKVVQTISVLADQRVVVAAVNLKGWAFFRVLDLDICGKTKVSQHRIENFVRAFRSVHGAHSIAIAARVNHPARF